jgi:hypothetical protein
MKPKFIPGLELSKRYYFEGVHPILAGRFPGLLHTAALIGDGSEVLGFDDSISTDHHWGPRLLLFLPEEDRRRLAEPLRQALAENLPYEFLGYPTNFTPPDPDDNGVQRLQPIQSGPVNHRVEILTIQDFFSAYLHFDLHTALEPADWLSFSEQHLRAITAGAVFHDDLGLEQVRALFAYYPHDVWLYLLAAGWARLGQEEHLMGRAGMVGDEVGSALIGPRLVRDVMRLCFLMERTYAPYAKWFGTAFKRLACADELWPHLSGALRAEIWQTREESLVKAYELLATQHNALGLTELFPTQARLFWGRPFRVIAQHGFAAALLAQIRDPVVKRIAARPPIGGIDQLSDNTDLLENPEWRPLVRHFYE